MKRTIERLILVPLARQIASGKLPAGSTVMLGLKGGRIRPKVLELGESEEAVKAESALHDSTWGPLSTHVQRLQNTSLELAKTMQQLGVQKTELLNRVNSSDLHDSSEKMAAFDQVYRWDMILSRYQRFVARVQELGERPHSNRSPKWQPLTAEQLSGLELESRILAGSALSQDEVNTADVVVTLTLIESRGQRLSVVEKLARMYQGFLTRLEFPLTILNDQAQAKPLVDQISFLVSGPGSYLVLKQEHGLHVFRRTQREETQREVAQVEVLPLASNFEETFLNDCTTEFRRLKVSNGRLGKRRLEASFFHQKSQVSLTAVLDSTPAEAANLLGPWLAALVDRQQALMDAHLPAAPVNIVRRYDLGANSLIRDTGSGQRWGHADRLLSGWLDRFVPQGLEPEARPPA